MDRRVFIQSAFLTAALCVSTASAGNKQTALAGAHETLTLYDPRFPKSRAVASRLAPDGSLRPIAGDVSELLAVLLASDSKPFKIAGVTTESVPFCLEQLLSSHARPQLESIRLDADLFAWTLTMGGEGPGPLGSGLRAFLSGQRPIVQRPPSPLPGYMS